MCLHIKPTLSEITLAVVRVLPEHLCPEDDTKRGQLDRRDARAECHADRTGRFASGNIPRPIGGATSGLLERRRSN